MKEEKNDQIPNIKHTKLEEEVKDKNQPIPKRKSLLLVKMGKYKDISFCLFYILLFMIIILYFIINYKKTKDAFKDNKYITIPYEKLCTHKIKELAICYKEKKSVDCTPEEKLMEACYDQAYEFNTQCYIYISELELCMRKNNNKGCSNFVEDIVRCGFSYRLIKVDREYFRLLFFYKK